MPELSPADIEFIKDLREAREDERISRRDLMTLLGGGVVGAAAGGGGLAATGLASAEASTSDSDGNVGLPGDRVDVFADGVDAAVMDTDDLSIDGAQAQMLLDGYVVPVAPGLGVKDAVDPSSFTNPYNEAVSRVQTAASSGVVYLPQGRISQQDDMDFSGNVVAIGTGDLNDATSDASVVQVTSPTNGGINVTSKINRMTWGNFVLEGPGGHQNGDSSTKPALTIDGAGGARISECCVLPMGFRKWGNKIIDASDSASEYGNNWQLIFAQDFDAGDAAAAIQIARSPVSDFGPIHLYPQDDRTGSTTTALDVDGGMNAGYVALGGSTGTALKQQTADSEIDIDHIRYEPTDHASTPFQIFSFEDKGMVRIGRMALAGSLSASHVCNVYSGGANKYLGAVRNRDSFSITGDLLRIPQDTAAVGTFDAPIITEHTSGQVNNATGGTLTQAVVCLGDLSTVS